MGKDGEYHSGSPLYCGRCQYNIFRGIWLLSPCQYQDRALCPAGCDHIKCNSYRQSSGWIYVSPCQKCRSNRMGGYAEEVPISPLSNCSILYMAYGIDGVCEVRGKTTL